MNEKTERIVYDESVRGLVQQQQKIEALRGRAGTLLGAAALVAAFLGGQALEAGGGLTALEWSAIGSFVVVLVVTLALLSPWFWRWGFAHDAHLLMDVLLDADPPASEGEVYRHLAYYNALHWQKNAVRLNFMFGAFAAGSLALVAETALWLADIAWG